MSTVPAFQSGLNGIQSGLQSLNRNAAKIASVDTIQSGADITEPLINLIRDKQQVQPSAKVIEASNNLIGTILRYKSLTDRSSCYPTAEHDSKHPTARRGYRLINNLLKSPNKNNNKLVFQPLPQHHDNKQVNCSMYQSKSLFVKLCISFN
jgi:hypothetical protein